MVSDKKGVKKIIIDSGIMSYTIKKVFPLYKLEQRQQ